MADERFAEDTVFVIFEGDYCLLQSDERARQEWEAAQDKIGLELRATYELAAALPDEKRKEFKNQYLRWNARDELDEQLRQETPFPEPHKWDAVANPKAFPKKQKQLEGRWWKVGSGMGGAPCAQRTKWAECGGESRT